MAAIRVKVQSRRRSAFRAPGGAAVNGRLTLLGHKASMVEKNEGQKSDWRALAAALLHVGAIFVPIALCMLVLAGLSAHTPQEIDSIRTGSIDGR